MWLWAVMAGWAGETEIYVGGGLDARGGWSPAGSEAVVEGEFDFRLRHKWFFTRLDLDVTVDVLNPGVLYTPPEWAMVQFGLDDPAKRLGWAVRAGVLNPNMGLEDWDLKNNYLPSYSIMFNGASPGRILGGEANLRLGDGHNVFLWGGSDIDWAWPEHTPTLGVGYWTERDSWSTWSGLAMYPSEQTYMLVYTLEFYPHDLVWLAFDGSTGVMGGRGYGGGQVVLNVAPEEIVQPVARGEWVVDPGDAALGGMEEGIPDGTASLGARFVPSENVKVMVEGKAIFADKSATPGLYFGVEIFTPDPPYYGVVDEGEVPEEIDE
jgi:hypothetical protein